MTRTPARLRLSMVDLLVIGHPGEVLGDDEITRIRAAARVYIGDPSHPAEARQRVHEVWILGLNRPSWNPRSASNVVAEVSS